VVVGVDGGKVGGGKSLTLLTSLTSPTSIALVTVRSRPKHLKRLACNGVTPAAILLDDLLEIEHVGERVAALFHGLEFAIHLLDPLGRQASADVVGDPLHQVFGLGQYAALSDGKA
jgi:hypothetical protein